MSNGNEFIAFAQWHGKHDLWREYSTATVRDICLSPSEHCLASLPRTRLIVGVGRFSSSDSRWHDRIQSVKQQHTWKETDTNVPTSFLFFYFLFHVYIWGMPRTTMSTLRVSKYIWPHCFGYTRWILRKRLTFFFHIQLTRIADLRALDELRMYCT